MARDIFGVFTPQKNLDTTFEIIAVCFPIITILGLSTLFIALQFGFVRRFKIRLLFSLTTLMLIVWLFIGNYHVMFGIGYLTDWFAHWTGGLALVATILCHLELLKSFCKMGGIIKVRVIHIMMGIVLVMHIVCFVPLYFLLDGNPQIFWLNLFKITEALHTALIVLVDVAVLVYLVYSFLKFIKSRRIQRHYGGIANEKNIIVLALLGILFELVGPTLHILFYQSTTEGFSWWQINSAIGCWGLFTLPLIFNRISLINRIELATPPAATVAGSVADTEPLPKADQTVKTTIPTTTGISVPQITGLNDISETDTKPNVFGMSGP